MTALLRTSLIAITCSLQTSGCSLIGWTRAKMTQNNQSSYSSNSIEDTRALPPRGKGYRTYSSMASAIGRQYGHSDVIDTLQKGFSELSDKNDHTYIVAEIGSRKGGRFRPHATHRRGMSVDILTPMKRISSGKPSKLPSSLWNLYGYCWHLDNDHSVWGLKWSANTRKNYCPTLSFPLKREVDFSALRDLVNVMSKTARKKGGRLRYVIVSEAFKKPLGKTDSHLTSKAWIEHDDHIHLEFAFD